MKLSIIIPVYNVEEYLEECLCSIQIQSFSDYEILLINDGSTDRSPEICDRHAKDEPRIRVIHSRNKGVSNARNLGIEAARGEYILFIDADDVLAGKDAIRDMMRFTKDPEVDLVAARNDEFYDQKQPEKLSEGRRDSWHFAKDSVEVMRFTSMHLMMANLYSRQLIGGIRFDTRIKLGEDCLFLIEILSNVKKPIICDRIIYHRRLRPESASHASYEQGMIEENELLLKLFYMKLHGKQGGDELFEKHYVDQTGMINRLMPEYKKYWNEVQVVRGRIRECFPHFLRNELINLLTKVILVLYLINPSVFYLWFKPYKEIKRILTKRPRGI